ncbi:MAG: type I-U CRISPR-associated protein Cas5/Cas6 [Planctomycetota bacterium]|nr:MAG: type I-U CRISPR-associated protein Cas5/Cas6 [Planctomycetota bacterium]
MPSFALVIEYLTGYAVATDTANRERAEWPPHPARVFMALAAAHFETEPTNAAQREALQWLAALDAPNMTIPDATPRDVLTVYVPVNDQKGGEALVKRSRQPRHFPRMYVGETPVRLTWESDSPEASTHIDALEDVCRSVTRIGHSSSLTWVRVERGCTDSSTHIPDERSLERQVRVTSFGALKRLEDAFNKTAIDDYVALEEQVSSSKGKAKKNLQEQLKERFPRGKPTSQRPVFSISRGYRPIAHLASGPSPSPFDPNFIVLRAADDNAQSFGLESTAQITAALRSLIMSASGVQPVPAWVSGHEPSGEKLASGNHMAFIPLAFAGRPWIPNEQFADGHLMGLGILLPRDVTHRERARVLGPILFDPTTSQPKPLTVTLGRAGVWTLVRDTGLTPKRTLDATTYTAPSRSWASVTPVVLDRMPKTDRVKDPVGWRAEVAGIVTQSCGRVGLPTPIAVRVEKTPFFMGSLRAMPGQGGFPQLRVDKFQVHLAIDFEEPAAGPVLLGAGRFRGYGLMRPWQNRESQCV